MLVTNLYPTIHDAGSSSDFWEAARAAGGAKEVEVRSDHQDGALADIAADCLEWAAGDLDHLATKEPAEIRRELRFLLGRARSRALLRARQFKRVARLRVAITREGDHLLALMTEVE